MSTSNSRCVQQKKRKVILFVNEKSVLKCTICIPWVPLFLTLYQKNFPCDLCLCWNWRSLATIGAIVFHKHILLFLVYSITWTKQHSTTFENSLFSNMEQTKAAWLPLSPCVHAYNTM